jgi:hypothetical protein
MSSLPLLAPRQCLAPACHLSTLNSQYRQCRLAYPYDVRGFVGAKKKTSVDLLLFNPLCLFGESYELWCGSGTFCLIGSGKIRKIGTGSGINHSRSRSGTIQFFTYIQIYRYLGHFLLDNILRGIWWIRNKIILDPQVQNTALRPYSLY